MMTSSRTAAVHLDRCKSGYDNVHYYAIQITSSQFLNELCNDSAGVTPSCNYKFAPVSRYIIETVQTSAKVTVENVECE